MYRGRFQLGQVVPLWLQCRNAAGTPTVPTRPPTAVVWSAAGTKVMAKEMPVVDKAAVAGLFCLPLVLDGNFAEGCVSVVYRYNIGSFVGLDDDDFLIIPGGNVDGQVLAMHFFHRPHADFVVHQLASGKLAKGRNPRV